MNDVSSYALLMLVCFLTYNAFMYLCWRNTDITRLHIILALAVAGIPGINVGMVLFILGWVACELVFKLGGYIIDKISIEKIEKAILKTWDCLTVSVIKRNP